MPPQPVPRDVIVMGASAGGIEALSAIVAGLPADLPASVFVVQHADASFASRLPEILARRCPLPVRHALHGEPIERGKVYVAPSDNHLMLRPGYLHVARGPKENGHRPSVDALFRTASTSYGPRVIGVVLTGYLDCGTAGLLSVKARGGVAVVQDPREAFAPDMPSSAIRHVEVDHVAPLHDIAPLLSKLARQPAGPPHPVIGGALQEIEGDELGAPSDLVCPTCQGVLTESELQGFRVFRCHVGHSFSIESIASEQAESVERALWAAVRALDESASLARRVGNSSSGAMQRRFEEKAETLGDQADVIRQLLLHGRGLSRDDAPDVKKVEESAAPSTEESPPGEKG